ncbi:putative disease resistance protein At1g50180 isoform X2 [Humulus lupulus]|uniref:putative disease resistance protein At1g50180 isoform X2 n=1 Tax=Humulus lupulus TaxID=3486 RepID=UPI002B4101CD|nr:putative disease resistance protein At1g50180 isoform X2 [Humulus lupulus]
MTQTIFVLLHTAATVELPHHFSFVTINCTHELTLFWRCQPRDVWEGILIRLASPAAERRREIKGMRDDEIAKALYKVHTEKRCLVVLDDIWNASTWDCLKLAFPNVRSDSKIRLTARNREVAFHANRNIILHERRCFNTNETWELFMIKTYFGGDDTDEVEDYFEIRKTTRRRKS